MHIYAFGSVCRGDISIDSDIDLLAIVDGFDPRFDARIYSIYSYDKIQKLWNQGNPFAWHLSLESRMLFSSDESDYLKQLDTPASYKNCAFDCEKFYFLFKDARLSLETTGYSKIFDLSTIFLSIRNIATCFSLGVIRKPDFSRNAALRIGERSITILESAYRILERSRLLCTRGIGSPVTRDEIIVVIDQLDSIENWIDGLVLEAKQYA